MTIGAVVVNHNAGASLFECIESLHRAKIEDIVIVDNASSDNSLEKLSQVGPNVRIIRTGKNLGYGTAVNVGRKQLVCDHLFVCNPDLVVEAAAPRLLSSYLDQHPGVGIVGPKIFETSGEVYPSARSFPNIIDALGHGLFGIFWSENPFSRRYKSDALGATVPRRVDWVSGACFLTVARAFDAVSGFDEQYFMYVEDLDLCWRLNKAGWTIAYEPAATVIHHGGVSARRRPYRMLVAHHASTWRFARRRLVGAKRLILPLVGAGILFRLVLALVRQAGRP